MRYLLITIAVLALSCTNPSDPVEYNQFAAGDTFPQLSNLPMGGDENWPPPGHLHMGPFVCWTCAQTIGYRDHDGDGFNDRTNQAEGSWPEVRPPPPPVEFQPLPPYGFQ